MTVQVEITHECEAMYDSAFAAFLQAVRTKDPTMMKSSFGDALKTYQTTKWIADASMQTPQSAWDAPNPWVTSANKSCWSGSMSDVVQETRQQQSAEPGQVGSHSFTLCRALPVQ